MMESLYLWEKGCTNGIRTVEILPIFPCFLWGYVLILYLCGVRGIDVAGRKIKT